MRSLAHIFLPALLLLALGGVIGGQVSATGATEVALATNQRLVVLETFMRPG
jgi:hypothetical protein